MELFNHESFKLVALTEAYNTSTYFDHQVFNMFKVENVNSREVVLIKSGNTLQVLLPGEIGKNPNIDQHQPQDTVTVRLIRYPFKTQIVPKDLLYVASLTSSKAKKTELATLVKEQMGRHKGNHRYTNVFTCYTALKGVVKDKNDNVLWDLFDLMGTTQRKKDLKLGTATSDVPKLIQEAVKETKDKAKENGNSTLEKIECRVGQAFIQKILAHPTIKNFYGEEMHSKRVVAFADDPSQINICGMHFISDEAAAVEKLGASYPVGVPDLFRMLRCPPEVLKAASTANRECHITKEFMPHDEGLEIQSSSIYLPVTKNPRLLCEIYSSN